MHIIVCIIVCIIVYIKQKELSKNLYNELKTRFPEIGLVEIVESPSGGSVIYNVLSGRLFISFHGSQVNLGNHKNQHITLRWITLPS